MPDLLSATFSALADPTRRAILVRLAKGEATVNELAEPFEISLPAVSRHLKMLETAGLISRGREAQWRPCKLEPARTVLCILRHTDIVTSDQRLAAYIERCTARPAYHALSVRNSGIFVRRRSPNARGECSRKALLGI